jgi:predicted N-acetyltransferase YhbS
LVKVTDNQQHEYFIMTDLPLVLRLEEPSDSSAIERLHERAFGPGRFARTAYRLREGVPPIHALCFIAQVGTMLVGSVRLNAVKTADGRALILGPLAVEPAFSDRGIGTLLMEMALGKAKDEGHRLVFLVGDLPFYTRFGFKIVPQGRVMMPGPVDPQRFLVLELQDGAMAAFSGLLMASE